MENKVGELIKEFIEKTEEMSINKLGVISGVSPAHISRIINGKRKAFPETLKKLSKPLGIEYEELLKMSGVIDEDNSGEGISQDPKREKDVEKALNELLNQTGLQLCGELLEDQDIMALKQAIEIGIKYAKENNKKYIPKKYRK